jgi:hypothetical protein
MASKLQKLFGNIAKFAAPVAGYAFGGPVGAGIGGAVGGAVSGTGSLKRAAVGGLGGFGAGSLAQSFGVPSFSGSGSNPLSGIGGALGKFFGGSNAMASTAPSTLSQASSYGNPFSSFMGSASGGSSMVGAVPGFSQASSALNPSGGGGLNKLKDMFKGKGNLLTGLGIAGASQLFGSPDVPELPDSVRQYQEMVRNGGSALNQQAQGALSSELSRPFEQVSQEEEQAALRQLEKSQKDEEDQIRDLYRNLRPGTDPSTDSAFRRDLGELGDRYAKTKADTVAQLRRQVSNDFQANRIRQILAAQGVDQQQMQNLLAANQYDVDRTLAQLSIDDRDKKFLREYLFGFGGNLVANSLGVQQQSPLERFLSMQQED